MNHNDHAMLAVVKKYAEQRERAKSALDDWQSKWEAAGCPTENNGEHDELVNLANANIKILVEDLARARGVMELMALAYSRGDNVLQARLSLGDAVKENGDWYNPTFTRMRWFTRAVLGQMTQHAWQVDAKYHLQYLRGHLGNTKISLVNVWRHLKGAAAMLPREVWNRVRGN